MAQGCSFGGRFYALEDTWHPDLGEPFGVMHCVVCYCEPQRNRRGKPTGKVSCKNIKHDCPTLPCSEPVLLPGHCCKTCPKAPPSLPEKRPEPIFDSFEYFQDKEDDLHKSYNDRSYLSSEDLARDDSRTGSFLPDRGALVEEICGMWRNLHKPSIRLLKAEQLRISLATKSQPAGEIQGQIVKHRALFAETFSAILTSVDPTHLGTGGIAMLTLSDTENKLHFILMAKGLLEPAEKAIQSVLCGGDALTPTKTGAVGSAKLTLHKNGTLEYQVGRAVLGQAIQSVLCGGDALTPTKTGAVGSAKLTLHKNGTLEYQVQVAGTASEVLSVTLETKPRRKNKRNILLDMTPSYREGLASGIWQHMNARDTHMLLQSELFLNVATKDFEEGEVRGQIRSLLYSGLLARYTELPVPLAGQLVSPPVRTSSAGHAWVSLDEHCHLHYEIVVGGLGKVDDVAISAHLHGVAELGERSHEHTRLLKGFYGTEVKGPGGSGLAILMSLLGRALALLQPGPLPAGALSPPQVHIPNQCESGGVRLAPEEDELLEEPKAKDPALLKKDPNSCFFEGQHRAHGSRWAPAYDRKCSLCSCQKRTVICDPILCQPLNCTQQVHLEDRCCPVCEGCYFDGDKTWRGAGTRWHPVVPPFGLIKCAICTCKGATGEVHCEKVQCPRLTCSNPVRVSPSDCCKQCPAPEKSPPELSDMMQADGPRPCRFGRQWYMNNESWHPTVPPFGEMKCITCWCVSGETHCQRQEFPPASCSSSAK
nr:chordin [Pelodiscus sinensis]|eukprot:XP_025034940.1 chordin [Pelodiscus sinensis]